jgi:hypothetical protein
MEVATRDCDDHLFLVSDDVIYAFLGVLYPTASFKKCNTATDKLKRDH